MEQAESKLCKKQKAFCRIFVQTRNGREAALAAGYPVFPSQTASKLLANAAVQAEITRLEQKQHTDDAELVAGYRRLAFGSVADAVKLLLTWDRAEAPLADVDSLDLFLVSEIKRPKTGGMEIKFFDRQKALEKLAELRSSSRDTAEPFYAALAKSAAALQSGGEAPCE